MDDRRRRREVRTWQTEAIVEAKPALEPALAPALDAFQAIARPVSTFKVFEDKSAVCEQEELWADLNSTLN